MNSFAKDIAEYLENNSYGEISKDIFIDNLPEMKGKFDDCVAVYNTQSYAHRSRAYNAVEYTCQIRIRDKDSEKAYNKALAIYNEIDCGNIITPNGKAFMIKIINPPFFLMLDTCQRANWIINITGVSNKYK